MLKSKKNCITSFAHLCLKVERHGSVKRLVLNSPKTLNALSDRMMRDILKEVTDISTKNERCLLIDSSSKVFCAGHDLKELRVPQQASVVKEPQISEIFALCTELMLALRKAPIPVIALIDGAAVAAGKKNLYS